MNEIEVNYQIVDETDKLIKSDEKTIRLSSNIYFDDMVRMLIKNEGLNIKYPLITDLCDKTWEKILSKRLIMYKDEKAKYDWKIPHYMLGDMQEMFDFFNTKLVIINSNGGFGGVVGDKEGITFIIHSNEADRHFYEPHVHCKYGNEEFRYRLDTLQIMKDDIYFKNRKKTKIAKKWVEDNRIDLLDYYKKFAIKSKSIEYIANI